MKSNLKNSRGAMRKIPSLQMAGKVAPIPAQSMGFPPEKENGKFEVRTDF